MLAVQLRTQCELCCVGEDCQDPVSNQTRVQAFIPCSHVEDGEGATFHSCVLGGSRGDGVAVVVPVVGGATQAPHSEGDSASWVCIEQALWVFHHFRVVWEGGQSQLTLLCLAHYTNYRPHNYMQLDQK